jgi:uroporphyrinogen decarboxylase
MKRRDFLLAAAAAPAVTASPKMTPRERVDRALAGKPLDRPPFTLWYHFGLEKKGPEAHAEATLSFHRRFSTDLVKVMSDFPYPKPAGNWYDLRGESSPFAPQIRALEIIRGGLGGRAHFVETLFNPWNVAEKLSSKEEVARMMQEQPQRLLDALAVIAKSEANHARKAIAAGASGIFLAIANAQEGIVTREQYAKFSEPFDRMILDAVPGAPLNTLHLHGDKVYLDLFWKNWPAAAINYSSHGTGVSVAAARKQYGGVLLAGIDERNYRSLKPDQLRAQMTTARREAGAKFILTPGCSVPNETKDDEAIRLTRLLT